MPRAMVWLLTLTLACGVVVIVLDRVAIALMNPDPDRPKVLALPADHRRPANQAPYSGPHPRQMDWSAESFEFPILPGQTGPVKAGFTGSLQYPFLCRTLDSDLGPPLVDNQDGVGMAVYAEGDQATPLGFSRDCLLPTRVSYLALDPVSGDFKPLGAAGAGPDGQPPALVVRVETGTINRFIYMLAMPVDPLHDQPGAPDLSRWNRRLMYYFRGGVGIGYRQGRAYPPTLLKRRLEALKRGYAVAYSSGNQTSNTYNIWLNADTARRVKRQFETAYGRPDYTIGLGGSGGAIQQYLLAQNFPGILDGAIVLNSYPDMVSQSNYVLDCELLEYYFDRTGRQAGDYHLTARRAHVEGASYSAELRPEFSWLYRLSDLAQWRWPRWADGATECTAAWRGATPLVINPRYAHFMDRFAPAVRQQTDWSYFGDLRQWFGTDAQGFGRRTWDNVGVQYGLHALRANQLSAGQFLHLNENIGGWQPPAAMEPARYWKSAMAPSSLAGFSPWSHHNQAAGSRTSADPEVIAAAWRSGQIFAGWADIPIIDLRQYLDPELDMHHALSSFQARARLLSGQGNADNQLIWMTRPDHQPYGTALDTMERWIAALRTDGAPPEDATDRCFAGDGSLIAAGDGVWDGAWNRRPPGPCASIYPALGTSRIVAGAPLAGHLFKCARKSVDQALADGTYGALDMQPHGEKLRQIFPSGVCDYSRPDPGLPADWRHWFSKEDHDEQKH